MFNEPNECRNEPFGSAIIHHTPHIPLIFEYLVHLVCVDLCVFFLRISNMLGKRALYVERQYLLSSSLVTLLMSIQIEAYGFCNKYELKNTLTFIIAVLAYEAG